LRSINISSRRIGFAKKALLLFRESLDYVVLKPRGGEARLCHKYALHAFPDFSELCVGIYNRNSASVDGEIVWNFCSSLDNRFSASGKATNSFLKAAHGNLPD